MTPILLAFAFTLPSLCYARQAQDVLTTRKPDGVACTAYSGYLVCRYDSRPYPMSCEKFDAEDPPAGQVWMRVEP